MESIDALAKAVNEFEGGLVLVSHDMRLISQVAKEIWICDNKTVGKYHGDIQNFKMDMRSQMGIEGEQKGQLRGDASVKKVDTNNEKNNDVGEKASSFSNNKKVTEETKKVTAKVKDVEIKKVSKPNMQNEGDAWGSDDESTKKSNAAPASSLSSLSAMKSSLPSSASSSTSTASGKYIPPHLRNRK